MNWLNTFKTIPLTILLLSGCSADKVPRVQHAGPVDTKPEVEREIPANPEHLNKMNQMDLNALQDKVNSADEKSWIEVKTQLEPFILNSNYVLDVSFTATARARSMLSHYNQAFINLLKKSENGYVQDLEKYFKFVSKGCDENLRGCQMVGFFKQDHRTAQILIYAIRKMDREIGDQANSEIIKKYYDALALAFEMKNSTRDTDLEFLYMKRARDYAQWYQSLDSQKQNLDIFKRHGRVFELIVNGFPNNPKNKEFQEFVAKFGPWRYSRLKADPFPFGTRRMFTFAASNSLYDQDGKKLSASLKEAIEESKKDPNSFTAIIASIENDQSIKAVLPGLSSDLSKVKQDSFYDEYFFMIDRLYKGHWDLQETTEVWNGSRKDSARLTQTLESYLKINILNLIIQTNKDVSSILTQPDLNNENLVKQTVARSKVSSDRWKMFLSGVEGRISSFIGANLRNSDTASASAKKAEKMIEALRRNVKYMSVYPNIILLSYFIQEMNATITIETFFGPYQIQSSEIIDQLFSGQTKVLFDFGNDTYPLNKIQLLYGYYFALTTGSFETYSGASNQTQGSEKQKSDSDKKISTVDRKSFFEKVIRQYLSKDRKRLDQMLTNYQNFRQGNSYKNLIGYCDALKKGEKDFVVQIDMDKFVNSSTFGPPSGNTSSGLINELVNIYYPDQFARDSLALFQSLSSDLAKSVEADRLLETKIAYVQVMVEILTHNMETLGFSQAQIDDIKKTANSDISSIQALSDNVYKEMLTQHSQAGGCLTLLTNFDRERNVQLLEMERDHLGKVYDFMLTLRNKSSQEVEALVKQNSATFGFEPGLDDVTAKTYKYNRMNVIRRMSARAAKMSPAVQVSFSTNWQEHRYATENQALNMTDKKEDFIRNGMSYFGNKSTAYLDWMKLSADISNLKLKIGMMTELYRYSQVRNLQNGVTAADLITEALEIVKFVSVRPNEKELMSYIGGYGRVPLGQLEGILLKENREKRSLMDFVLEALGKQKIIFDEAKTIYNSQAGEFLFAPDEKLFPTDPKKESQVVKIYKPLVQAHERAVRNFVKAVEDTEVAWASSQVEKKYLYQFIDQPEYFELSTNSNQRVELLSERVRINVKGRFDEHHSDTGNIFRQETP